MLNYLVVMTNDVFYEIHTFPTPRKAFDVAYSAKEVFDTASITVFTFESANWFVVVLPRN